MKTNIIFCIWAFLMIVLNACTKDDSKGFPSVTTDSNVAVSQNGAIINAGISQDNVFEIIDHGVVYCFVDKASIEANFDRISLGPLTNGSSFSVTIDRNLVANKNYVAKAYVQTKNRMVYGNEVSFTSKGSKSPVIKSFSPAVAYVNDTITISGQFFSSVNTDNKVYFSGIPARVVYSSEASVKAIVPLLTQSVEAEITIEVGGQNGKAETNFKLGNPVVYSIVPDKAFQSDKVKIRGKGFSCVDRVLNEDYSMYQYYMVDNTILSMNDSVIEMQVSHNVPKGIKNFRLKQFDRYTVVDKPFEVLMPEITSVSPKSAWLDTVIVIRGKYLQKFNSVEINAKQLSVLSSTDDLIRAKVVKPFFSGKVSGKWSNNNTVVSEDNVEFMQPVITSIVPAIAKYGETVRIKGDRFFPELSTSNYSAIDNIFHYVSKTEATLVVPWDYQEGIQSIPLGFDYAYTSAKINITIPKIKIASITPHEIKKGTEITVTFENLPSTITRDKVGLCKLGNNDLTLTEVNSSGIKAVVNNIYDCPEYPNFSLMIGNQSMGLENVLHLVQPWINVYFPELEGNYNYTLTSNYSSYDNALYGIFPVFADGHNTGKLVKFDPATLNWKNVSTMPTYEFDAPDKLFVNGSDLYIIGFSYDKKAWITYKYSISGDKWSKLQDLPDQSPNQDFGGKLFTMVNNNRIFVGKRNWFYEYDVTNNKWISRTTILTDRDITSPVTIAYKVKCFLGFPTYTIGNTEYSSLFEYDTTTDTWKDLGQKSPGFFNNYFGGSISTSYNGKFYIAGGSAINGNAKLIEFDPVSNTFKEMDVPFLNAGATMIIFVYNNYLYYGNYKGLLYKIPVTDFDKIYK